MLCPESMTAIFDGEQLMLVSNLDWWSSEGVSRSDAGQDCRCCWL